MKESTTEKFSEVVRLDRKERKKIVVERLKQRVNETTTLTPDEKKILHLFLENFGCSPSVVSCMKLLDRPVTAPSRLKWNTDFIILRKKSEELLMIEGVCFKQTYTGKNVHFRLDFLR